MKMTVIPIVIGAIGRVTKRLVKELEVLKIRGQVVTIQTTALLRSAKVLKRVLVTWRDLLSLKLQCKTICLTLVWKNSKRSNNNNNNKTKSLLIATQDNAIRTNHNKARIDKSQQNSKFRLCGDWDETINHIISECSKLPQKEYKARHDWVGKVIHWEMCKKFKFDHTNNWYMHNPAPVLENDTHKLLWDINMQTDNLIPARRQDLTIINKKKRKKIYKTSTLLSRLTTE